MTKKSIQHQIEQLRIGGYLDEAETMQRLSTQVNTAAEFKYLKEFASGGDFDFQLLRNQLRALWTAFCFHTGFDVDTAQYDSYLRELWNAIPDSSTDLGDVDWHDFDDFDNFMCAYLV